MRFPDDICSQFSGEVFIKAAVTTFLRLFTALLFICSCPKITAADLKRVLILDFKNIEDDENYQYLEASITDAVREMLKGKFEFQEYPREEAINFAQANLFMTDEFHTQSVAFQMGLLLKQDVVINGSYSVENETITTEIRIFDIGNRKLLKTIEVTGPASSQIFASVGVIAERIAEECQAVLPNKDEWKRMLAEEKQTAVASTPNLLTISTGISAFSFPSGNQGQLTSDTILKPGDFGSALTFQLGYIRNNVYRSFYALGNLGYQTASKDFAVENNVQKAQGKLTLVSIRAGIGYEMPGYQRFNWSPFAAAGYYFGETSLNYDNLPRKPLGVDSQPANSALFTASAPALTFGIRSGFEINSMVTLELITEYTNLFYANNVSGFVVFSGGMTLRL
ncbi:outer membrane protein [Turneriella parva]|uniref:Uncharacterized protein n=1 Tax=Turneriella parva (strain ATCC BAA-1111 / DSM 21527 / NCTC 11395 / H) TaxID=869212 RepID=I4B0A5_TURPD|nr:hypothetical protein [Turneriella parva]AFM10712.1 hypothetical protein Turpa_0049 [Turneriella parva DSM 21527]